MARNAGSNTDVTKGDPVPRQLATPNAMIEQLMTDNKNFTHAQREAQSICDDHGDVATASVLERFIDESERRTWLLYKACQREVDDQR